MRKVLLITFEYPIGKTYCGGAGQIVKQCRQALLELGCRVFVLINAEFRRDRPVKLLLPDGSLKNLRSPAEFRREYGWNKFDYIIHHFVNMTSDLKKVRMQKGRRPKIAYHFHSILRREKDSGFKTLNHFLLNQEKMIEIADRIICPSRYEYDNFIRYFPYFAEKTTLMENTLEIFPPREKEIRKIRREFGIRKDDISVTYVGRLEKIKGAHILVRHIPKILAKHKNIKVFIIGKVLERGIYKKLKSVRRRFARQLFYQRYVEKGLLFQYYYASDIYVNTSLSESFSLSTHESALCNNALLLSWLPVFYKFKDSALFFTNHDPKGRDFISKFEYLARNKELRQVLSVKAERVVNDFVGHNRLKEDFVKFFKMF